MSPAVEWCDSELSWLCRWW